MRSVIVAGVGGLILGHILWLLVISLVLGWQSTSTLVLLVAAVVFAAAGVVGYRAWQRYERRDMVWAAFLGALPVSPVIFTLIALGVTYL